jgi:superfamily I DNA/RNA helicase/mRNA-degrading endonuclease RelE of RelBE toxin-antitoxin system
MQVHIALTPTFFKAYCKLPAGLQEKVYKMMLKFRQEPTSSALNYEKLHAFKNKQLRSLRVDQTYRAILHAPENGEGVYHFLWVDHHDEAYAWAANKRFDWNKFTDSFQLIHLEENMLAEQVSAKATGPLANLREEELLRLGVPDIFVDKIPGISTLEELQKWQPYLPVDVYEYLFLLIEHTPREEVLQEVASGKSRIGPAAWDTANNRRFSHIITDDTALKEALMAGSKAWQLFLHPSQRRLAEGDFSGSVRLSGGAGTGKTVVALHRARYICEHWIGAAEPPLLITTFTKSLTNYLRENLQTMGVPAGRYEVNNLHNLAVCHAKKLGLVADDFQMIDYQAPEFSKSIWQEVLKNYRDDYEIQFFVEEYSEMILHRGIRKLSDYLGAHREPWQLPLVKNGISCEVISKTARKTIWKIMMDYEKEKKALKAHEQDEVVNLLADYYEKQEHKPYSYLICDELQDFNQSDFRLMRALVSEKPNDLFLLGDPQQKVYDKRGDLTKAGIRIMPGNRHHLRINYRTTDQIRQQAMQVLQGSSFNNFEGDAPEEQLAVSAMQGEVPVYHCFDSKDEEVRWVIDKLRPYFLASDGEEPAEISHICICARKKYSLKPFEDTLKKLNFPYCYIRGHKLEGDPRGVRLSTMHSIKGMEFRTVCLVDISADTTPFRVSNFDDLPPARQDILDQLEKSLLYVAMSRAVERLYISGTGEGYKGLIV